MVFVVFVQIVFKLILICVICFQQTMEIQMRTVKQTVVAGLQNRLHCQTSMDSSQNRKTLYPHRIQVGVAMLSPEPTLVIFLHRTVSISSAYHMRYPKVLSLRFHVYQPVLDLIPPIIGQSVLQISVVQLSGDLLLGVGTTSPVWVIFQRSLPSSSRNNKFVNHHRIFLS